MIKWHELLAGGDSGCQNARKKSKIERGKVEKMNLDERRLDLGGFDEKLVWIRVYMVLADSTPIQCRKRYIVRH